MVVVVVVVSASQLFFRLRVGRPVLALRGYIAPEWTMIIWTLRGRMCSKYSLSTEEILFLSERNSFLKNNVCEDKTLESSFQRKENLRNIVADDRKKKEKTLSAHLLTSRLLQQSEMSET